jgi:uncharacterized protein (DUF362 family)
VKSFNLPERDDVVAAPERLPGNGHGSPASESRLFIGSLDRGYDAVLRSGFDFLGRSGKIGPQDRVVIKPNLTYPTYSRGVMTSPAAVEALVRYLKDYTSHITVCEADSGGYNPFSMNEVFRATGLNVMAQRYGIRLINLSEERAERVMAPAGFRKVAVPTPTILLEETDLFITVPVPKVHMNTVISVALKNQWGTIQRPAERLRLHPYFKEVVTFLNSIYSRTIAVVDGKFGLTRSGPLRGDPVELNWVIVCDDFYQTDAVVAQILGYRPDDVPYLSWGLKRRPKRDLVCNTDWRAFCAEPFYLKRAWTDYPGLLAFRSRPLAYLAYQSPLARALHWLLYRFREPFY